MRHAAQACLNRSDNNRNAWIRFLRPLGIDQQCPVRSFSRHTARCIGIIRTDFALCGITVHHRIHIARCDAVIQAGTSQCLEILHRAPVRLGNDTDLESLGFQYPADDRCPETGMVDIGIPRHDDDVTVPPAQQVHLLPGHRQERRSLRAPGTA